MYKGINTNVYPTSNVTLCGVLCELVTQDPIHPSPLHVYCKSKAHHFPGSLLEGGLVGSPSLTSFSVKHRTRCLWGWAQILGVGLSLTHVH